jgi:cysteine desulfuration protein SufE
MAEELTAAIDDLVESFDLFDDWEEKYRYIIELGDELRSMPDEFKTEEHRVQGCQSQVWVTAEVLAGEPPRIRFAADSDSQIVRGLIAILMSIYSDRTPQEVLEFDIEVTFDKLELRQHLSRSRSNGLYSMVRRVKDLAQAAV